jgi:HTH-type transcriptional regulator/antitoxin HigA
MILSDPFIIRPYIMAIRTESDHRAGLLYLEVLLAAEPRDYAAIDQLGADLETYQNEHAHNTVSSDSLIYRIERYMFEHRLQKQELAQLLGISAPRLSQILSGKRPINMDIGRRLKDRLHIPADFILDHA